MSKKIIIIILICSLPLLKSNGQSLFKVKHASKQEQWVDSIFKSLSETQRLGQLFMIAAYSNQNENQYKKIDSLITRYNIGGLIFFQGGPQRQYKLTQRYQKIAQTPLFIAIDAEWGLGMRLDSTMNFPKQVTLGAVQNNELIQQMGAQIAEQCKTLGIHINFAPVVDINSNSQNPVIGRRSFGENKQLVTLKGLAYMKGLQENGVIATAKHFPGHGDTGKDSHLTLPVIRHAPQRLDTLELFPFKKLIKEGLLSMMVAHIHIPAYDDIPNKATTLSYNVVTNLLKKKLNFDGLIFTDALNMKGVSQFYPPGEVDVQALIAGNDILLFSEDVPKAIEKIKKAVKQKKISKKEIHKRIKKILEAKYWSGLYTTPLKIKTEKEIENALSSPEAEEVQHKLYEEAITVVKNDEQSIPIHILDTASFASLALNADSINTFQNTLSKYATFDHFNTPEKDANGSYYRSLLKTLKSYEVVIVGVHQMGQSSKNQFNIRAKDLELIESLKDHTKLIVVVFGNPYSLNLFEKLPSVICAYEDNAITQNITPQIIFGAISAKGKLPVSASPTLIQGHGIETKTLGRLGYATPEAVGMDSKILQKIDDIANEAIKQKATPGCQVLIARQGNVIFEKSYGYYTYDSLEKVSLNTIYDVASVTKVVATLQAIMFLEERGNFNLDSKISAYLKELRKSNKKNLIIRNILTHQAGLLPFIPFWNRTVTKNDKLDQKYYRDTKQKGYEELIATDLYGLNTLSDSLWKWIIDSDLRKLRRKQKTYDYRYSDLGFYILFHLAEELINQPLEQFLLQNFYDPLGLQYTRYLPLEKYALTQIAPTAHDTYFRKKMIHGTVHDEGAAMQGGIAGHAGLFSNAHDLAILFQMLLQNGYYGGVRYFHHTTIPKFIAYQSNKSRRGLGWDKPDLRKGYGPTSRHASVQTFGHTGFTGIGVWADPKYELIFVFLSNRVYPDATNRKLIEKDIRIRMHDIAYEAIKNYKKKSS